jgi:hypothetical protein
VGRGLYQALVSPVCVCGIVCAIMRYQPVLDRPDSRKIYNSPRKFVWDFADCSKINFALDCFSPPYRIFRYKRNNYSGSCMCADHALAEGRLLGAWCFFVEFKTRR